jgi:hypothetical protein
MRELGCACEAGQSGPERLTLVLGEEMWEVPERSLASWRHGSTDHEMFGMSPSFFLHRPPTGPNIWTWFIRCLHGRFWTSWDLNPLNSQVWWIAVNPWPWPSQRHLRRQTCMFSCCLRVIKVQSFHFKIFTFRPHFVHISSISRFPFDFEPWGATWPVFALTSDMSSRFWYCNILYVSHLFPCFCSRGRDRDEQPLIRGHCACFGNEVFEPASPCWCP